MNDDFITACCSGLDPKYAKLFELADEQAKIEEMIEDVLYKFGAEWGTKNGRGYLLVFDWPSLTHGHAVVSREAQVYLPPSVGDRIFAELIPTLDEIVERLACFAHALIPGAECAIGYWRVALIIYDDVDPDAHGKDALVFDKCGTGYSLTPYDRLAD